MIKRFFLLLLISSLSLVSMRARESDINSLQREMKHLNGEDLLKAHSKLCGIAFEQDDSIQELRFLAAYIEEAHRQGNVKEEAFARNSKIMCYYNYNMEKELIKSMPLHLDFLASNKLWNYFYNSWSLLVDMYIYQNKVQTALREAKKIYEDARLKNNTYGLGVSSYNIGDVYHHMQNIDEAERYYLKAIQTLYNEDDMTVLMSSYENYAEILSAKANYDGIKELSKKWKNKLDILKARYKKRGDSPSELSSKYRYCYEAMAEAEMETGNLNGALKLLHLAERLTMGDPPIAHLKLLREYARYYELVKEYDKALEYNNQRIELNTTYRNDRGLLDAKEQRASLLMSVGRSSEAAMIFQEIIPIRDSLASAQTFMQLNELNTLYKVDELTLEKKVATTRLYLSLIIVVILLIAVFLYTVYTRRLHNKNRILYDTIQQSKKVNPVLEISTEDNSEQELDNEGKLYQRLIYLMQTEEAFKDPLLRRDGLARLLNKNHVYLANAIRKYADNSTINDFINEYRLRYAGNLLTNNHNLNISEVEYRSGFNSRTTFGRLFRDYYGMSPSEYKTISQEKKNTSIQ